MRAVLALVDAAVAEAPGAVVADVAAPVAAVGGFGAEVAEDAGLKAFGGVFVGHGAWA